MRKKPRLQGSGSQEYRRCDKRREKGGFEGNMMRQLAQEVMSSPTRIVNSFTWVWLSIPTPKGPDITEDSPVKNTGLSVCFDANIKQ